MDPYRIMIVDDSVVARRLLRRLFEGEPDCEVVGEANEGAAALELIERCQPDLVTLDLEMPGMSGLDVLPILRDRFGRLPVIVCSGHTEKGARATLDALMAGATDFVCKSPPPGSPVSPKEYLRQELLGKLRGILGRSWAQNTYGGTPNRRECADETPGTHCKLETAGESPEDYSTATSGIVVIGSSTGGPAALGKVLEGLLSSQPQPILIVQHMTKSFTGALADSLSRHAPGVVREARSGHAPAPGDILVATGDYHLDLAVVDGRVVTNLTKAPMENSCRPAVDVLFRAAARFYRDGVLGVVLTGMGQDGLAGAQAICSAGGQIIAQDQESSTVWGMPRAVTEAGLAKEVLNVKLIGPTIRRRVAKHEARAAAAR